MEVSTLFLKRVLSCAYHPSLTLGSLSGSGNALDAVAPTAQGTTSGSGSNKALTSSFSGGGTGAQHRFDVTQHIITVLNSVQV